MPQTVRIASVACILALAGAAAAQQGTQPGTTPRPGSQPGSTQPGTQPSQPGTQPRQPGMTQPSQPSQPEQPGMSQPGRDTGMQQPGMSGMSGQQGLFKMTGSAKKATEQEVQQATQGWPQSHTEVIQKLTQKYGQPTFATPVAVMWQDNAPFVYTIVYSGEIPHEFPVKHTDFLEQAIAYKVPADKVCDLAEFDGSLIVDRTRGTLAARCDKEENNFVALNLANDICTGKKQADAARQELAQIAQQSKSGSPHQYAQRLNFQPQRQLSGDPDRAVQPGGVLATPEDRPLDKPRDPMDKPRDPMMPDKKDKDPSKDLDKPEKDLDNDGKPDMPGR